MWSSVNVDNIETTPAQRGGLKVRDLKFQLPRGLCQYGLSEYKAINIQVTDSKFIKWWTDLEKHLCTLEPFSSNMKNGSLRVKVDPDVLVFDERKKRLDYMTGERDGAGKEMSCMVQIPSVYYFNGNYGLTVKCTQILIYDDLQCAEEFDEEEIVSVSSRVLLESDEDS